MTSSPARRAPRLLAGALALVLALAGLTVTSLTAPASAAATPVLTLKGPAQVRLGKRAKLTVTWRKASGPATGKVTLQEKRAGVWTTLRKVRVVDGEAQVKVAPQASTRYRLVKGKRTSKVVKVKVRKQWIAFPKPVAQIRAGDVARLTVTNVKGGAPAPGTLELQYRKAKGWKTTRTVVVGASGVATVDVSPKKDRTFRFVRGKQISPARTIGVERDWVELALDRTTLPDSASTAVATVRWFAAGKPANGTVRLQERLPGGKWRLAQEVAVVDGQASLTVRPTTPRRYRVRAGTLKSAVTKVKVTTVIPASFSIRGSGWGHGLGMSQYGAYAMAQAGKSAEEILTHYYTDTAVEDLAFPTGDGGTKQLSVQIVGASPDNKTSVPVTVRGGWWRLRDGDAKTVATDKASTITFTVESGKVAAYVGSATTPTATDSIFRLHWEGTRYYKPDSSKQTYVDVAGTHGSYRHGRLEVTVREGRINIVNNLLLNTEYLYGIAEVPSSWGVKGPASLEAQAIAARNYAASAFFGPDGKPRKVATGCRCHLVDDTRDQNFTGWRKESEDAGAYWKAAVDATTADAGATGKVLRYVGADTAYQGKLVTAYYSSSSGGATLNSEDAWSGYVPYIRSVEDPWSLDPASGNPNTSWTAAFTQSQARAFFGLPDVVAITVSRTYQGGGMAELTATASSGATATVSGKADTMRTRLNAASSGYVKSAFVTAFDPVGVS